MGGEVAGGARELAEVLGLFDAAQLAAEAVREHGHFLAEGGRRGRLTVGAREHRVVAELFGELCEAVGEGACLRQPHLLNSIPHRDRVREVVDVLARAGEVGEFGDVLEAALGEAGANVVFDGLHVVASGRLDAGELVDVGLAEVRDDVTQRLLLLGAQRGRAEEAAVGEEDEPLHLDVHAGAVEGGFGEVLAEGLHGGAVAGVEGTQKLRRQRHEVPYWCARYGMGASWRHRRCRGRPGGRRVRAVRGGLGRRIR